MVIENRIILRKECCRLATKKLTPKEKKFCQEYVRTGNASEAVRLAGYSEKNVRQRGSKMLAKDYILAYINELMEELKKEAIADADEVLQLLTSIARGETKEENVVVDKCGNVSIVETRVKEKERVKALELLGKRYKLYTDKVEANVEGKVEITFEGEDDIED